MCHIDFPPPNYADTVAMLRPGDILTHAFRPFPNAPISAQGKVLPQVLDARRRGVLFDIGHGMGSFAFKTARAMLANGFRPDTISPTFTRCRLTVRPSTRRRRCRSSCVWA